MNTPTPTNKYVSLVVLILIFSSVAGIKSQGLHGYIGSSPAATASKYGEGFGFYSAIWPLIPAPIANFQIGLPSTWIIPNNNDNATVPLCPVGTYARDHWPERGPTYADVFQTIEGSPGYWVGNKFNYGPPKFKMNSTPSCYDVEISTPGWQFFWSDTPLPDNMLGIAQLSNCLLYPPDGLTFEGNPNGEFLGMSYLSLPLTAAYTDKYPVGEKSWTLFLNAQNFKGPLAYYLPETWAKISENYPFDNGRGLDARSSKTNLSGGTMEINTVPLLSATDTDGKRYYKIPRLQFPVDSRNRTVLSKDVTFYSKDAIYNKVLAWREGGEVPSGTFVKKGAAKPTMHTYPVNYDQGGIPINGINQLATPVIFHGNDFGFQWAGTVSDSMRSFPEYFKDSANLRVAITASDVPPSTHLVSAQFSKPNPNPSPYRATLKGSWRTPGPVAGPFYAYLNDHSMVTYFWYRFIDQPVFQQFNWSQGKRDSLQHLVEAMHTNWQITDTYMPEPSSGELVSFDPELLVTPPPEYAIGYVPIVVGQEKSKISGIENLPVEEFPSMEVYPNPATQSLNVHLLVPLNNLSILQLMDLEGKMIQTVKVSKQSEVLDISKLANGTYILKYSDGDHTHSMQFIKTK